MKELWELNMDALEALYEKEFSALNDRLLNGESWHQVAGQRQRVIELSTVIFKKLNPQHFSNPAEGSTR